MSKEQTARPNRPRHSEVFGFTRDEALFYEVSDEHFKAILADESTSVHQVKADHNTYGSFLFVTVSRPTEGGIVALSFYGLGFHEHRERWITDRWHWYENHPINKMLEETLTKEEAEEQIRHHLEVIKPHITEVEQSSRARMFEFIADLTDEDGAYAELGDLENAGWFEEGDF